MGEPHDGGSVRDPIVRAVGVAARGGGGDTPSWAPRLARRTTSAVTTTDRRAASEPERDRALLRQVAAGTVDVRVHGERVERAVAGGDAEAAWSALVDTFVLLGTRARSVRQRLLFSAQEVIGPSRYAALREHLPDGLGPDQPIPVATRAVRHHGAVGWPDVIAAATEDGDSGGGAGTRGAPAASSPTTYRPEDHLSGVVQRLAVAMSGDGQARRLGGTWGSITLDRVGHAHLRVAPEVFDAACARPFVRAQHRLIVGRRALLGDGPRTERPGVRDETVGWPELAWELAARCSAGRPPADAPPTARWRLVRRLDLTPLPPVEHAARLAELLVRPSTVDELVWLVGDEGAVLRFLAAARAYGAVRETAPDEDIRHGAAS